MQGDKLGRIMVPSRAKKVKRPYLNGKKLCVLAYTCYPSNSRKLKIGGSR
jgi:hypothetical protein